MRCEVCGSDNDVKPTIACDLCRKCYDNLHNAHEIYAAAQRRNMSRDAGCPVLRRDENDCVPAGAM